MIMPRCHRPLPRAPRYAPVAAVLAAVLAPVPGVAAAAGHIDGNTAAASADAALRKGDCGAASRLYQQASEALEQPELAARASAVALACGQYPAARAIAERWLQFAPGDTGAMLALTQAELSSYQIPDARRHFRQLLNGAGGKVIATIDAVVQRAGSEPALAMMRDLEATQLRGAEAQLELGALALDAWDATLALRYALGARAAGATVPAAALITARAQAILGTPPEPTRQRGRRQPNRAGASRGRRRSWCSATTPARRLSWSDCAMIPKRAPRRRDCWRSSRSKAVITRWLSSAAWR